MSARSCDRGVEVCPVRIGQRVVFARSLHTGQVAQEVNRITPAAAEVRRLPGGDTMSKFADSLKAPAAPSRAVPATRHGCKHVGVYVLPDVAHRRRVLAAVENTTTQKLIEEGIERVFQSRKG